MANIKQDIEYYNTIKPQLELDNMGKWVLIHDRKTINIYDGFESAAEEAVRLFGRGPYLIRQVGAPPFNLPASVAFRLAYNG